MYQSIDDTDAEPIADAPQSRLNRLKITALILTGLILLVTVGIYSSQSRTGQTTEVYDAKAAYETYRKAMTEPNLAVRRARLIDFIQTQPKHDRVMAAEAQLSAIHHAESEDWAALTGVIYDPVQSLPAKHYAIELYETIWGTELLGAREDDLNHLKTLIDDPDAGEAENDSSTEPLPDFTPPKDKFDDNISGTMMAGGVTVPQRTYQPAPTLIRPPQQQRPTTETPPRIRKNVRPRYPSRALRRGIGAEIVLALNIDDEGKVQMTELVSARAPKYRKDFVKAAERAALRTRFHPATRNGNPTATSGVIKKYVFQVDD